MEGKHYYEEFLQNNTEVRVEVRQMITEALLLKKGGGSKKVNAHIFVLILFSFNCLLSVFLNPYCPPPFFELLQETAQLPIGYKVII